MSSMSSIIGALGTTVDLQAGPAMPAGIIGLLQVGVMAAPPAPIELPAVPTMVDPPVPGAPPVPATSPPVPVELEPPAPAPPLPPLVVVGTSSPPAPTTVSVPAPPVTSSGLLDFSF